MLEDKLNEPLNKYCVECGKEQPEYISINNGVFLCENCVQNHMKFPKNISSIKRNDLKSLTLNEIQYIYFGGNKNLLNFIRNEFPKLTELPPNLLYKTEALNYYRKNLDYSINGGIKPKKPSIDKGYEIIDNIYHNTIGNKIDSIYIDYGDGDRIFQTCDNNTYNDKNSPILINDLGYNFSTEPNYEINKITSTMNSTNSNNGENNKNNNVICYNQNQINNTSQKIKIKIKINNKKFLNNKKMDSQFRHFGSKKELSSHYLDRITSPTKTNIYKKPILLNSRNVSVERSTTDQFLKTHKTNFSHDRKSKQINKRNYDNLLNYNYSIPKISNFQKTLSNIEEIPIKLRKYQFGKNAVSEENTLSDLENLENSSAQKSKNDIIKILLKSKKNKNNGDKLEKKLQRKNIENKLRNIKENIETIKKSARVMGTQSLKNIFVPLENKKVISRLSPFENKYTKLKCGKVEVNKNMENKKNKEKNPILNRIGKYYHKNNESNNIFKKIEIKKELKQARSKDDIKKEKEKDKEHKKENENETSCIIRRMDVTKLLTSAGRNNNTAKKIRLAPDLKEIKKDAKKSPDFNTNKEKDNKEKQIFSIRNKYKQIKIK